ARTPARRQNGPRSGAHLGTNAATARSAKAEIAESEYCSRFPYDYFFRAGEAAAPALGVELVPGRVENAADIERVIESFGRTPGGGLIFPPDNLLLVRADEVIE